jgi:NADPH-dependent curcumin reductase CurA
VAELAKLAADGRLKAEETVVEGFEKLPEALNMLFAGENRGKLVVHIAE